MPYTRVTNLTFTAENFFEPGIKFFDVDLEFVKSQNPSLHSFELRNATYTFGGVIIETMVLIGLDADDNPLLGENDYAALGCPPGETPGIEIIPDQPGA